MGELPKPAGEPAAERPAKRLDAGSSRPRLTAVLRDLGRLDCCVPRDRVDAHATARSTLEVASGPPRGPTETWLRHRRVWDPRLANHQSQPSPGLSSEGRAIGTPRRRCSCAPNHRVPTVEGLHEARDPSRARSSFGCGSTVSPYPGPGTAQTAEPRRRIYPMPTGGPLVDPRMRAHRPGPTLDMWEMWRRKEVTVDGTSDARCGRSPQRLDPVPNESSGVRGVGNGDADARSR